MLKYLKLENVGPAAKMELNLGERLNIITGDNGLGKSFLLDVAWYMSTGCWPNELNSTIKTNIAAPNEILSKPSTLEIRSLINRKTREFKSEYVPKDLRWTALNPNLIEIPNQGLMLYFMADNSIAVFDPAAHYYNEIYGTAKGLGKAFALNSNEVWYGLQDEGKWKIDGLILDWVRWQDRNSDAFKSLTKVLELLSPKDSEKLSPGSPRRMTIEEKREVPTINMPYQGDIAVTNASSAIKRILAFAYMIVWTWEEHLEISKLRGEVPRTELTILFDELEAHLHPSWQRKILPALLNLAHSLSPNLNLQVIATTHSPLVMASLEPHFDADKDKWFDLDLVRDNGSKPHVELTERSFRKFGDAESWLHSKAFDLTSTRSIEGEALIREAKKLMGQADPLPDAVKAMHRKLVDSLDSMDEFLDYWRLYWKKKGAGQ